MSDSLAATGTFNLASRSNRLMGFMVDMAVVFSILLLKYLMASLAMRFYSTFGQMFFQVIDAVLTLLAFGYFLFCDALPKGQSLGKRLFSMSVVGYPYATNCTPFQSFLRNACKMLFSPLDGFLVLFGLRRRLGDMLAKTIVINA